MKYEVFKGTRSKFSVPVRRAAIKNSGETVNMNYGIWWICGNFK